MLDLDCCISRYVDRILKKLKKQHCSRKNIRHDTVTLLTNEWHDSYGEESRAKIVTK